MDKLFSERLGSISQLTFDTESDILLFITSIISDAVKFLNLSDVMHSHHHIYSTLTL